ncbi:MAG: hypothetical protein ACLQVX_08545 [Limisphaerales bacterium]
MADPLDVWHWRNPVPTGNHITQVVYLNGGFMATDGAGEFLLSSNGVDWTIRYSGYSYSLDAMAFGDGIYVAVGSVEYSDGVGAVILSSEDGTAWTQQTLPVPLSSTGPLHAVAYGNGLFVAVGWQNQIFASPDGVNWTSQGASLAGQLVPFGELYGIAYGNGAFVAAGNETSPAVPAGHAPFLASADGVNWTVLDSGPMATFNGVSYANGGFVAVGTAVGSDGSVEMALRSSADGATWSSSVLSTPDALDFWAATYGAGTYVVVGSTTGSGSSIYTSPDFRAWTALPMGAGLLNAVAYGNGVFVAAGEGLLTSTNGTNWIEPGSGITKALGDVSYGRGSLVAVGDGGMALNSSDGMRWSVTTTGVTNSLAGVAYGNGTFVSVGYGGTVITSTNGVDWAAQVSGITTDILDVCYGNGTFDAVARDGSILMSTNGKEWTAQNSGGMGYDLSGVTFGQGVFVVVGWSGVAPVVLTSSDGATWTSSSPQAYYLQGVGYGNGMFVAAGTGTIITSTDGSNWVAANLTPPTDEQLCRVRYAHGTFVIVGQGGTILTSTNGMDWVARNPVGPILAGITFGDETFVAVGDGGAILQSDPLPEWGLDLSPTGRLGDGSFALDAAGPVGQTWEISVSTNLLNWTWLAQFPSTNALIQFIDADARKCDRRFYRGQSW